MSDHELSRLFVASGCFWCTETDFCSLPGVESVTSGYLNGNFPNPTYEAVCQGQTGHIEGVKILYHPSQIDEATLLLHFLKMTDITDSGGQNFDRGPQYAPHCFYESKTTLQRCQNALNALVQLNPGLSLGLAITPFQAFYPAESYHQSYAKQCPIAYQRYRQDSQRDQRLHALAQVIQYPSVQEINAGTE